VRVTALTAGYMLSQGGRDENAVQKLGLAAFVGSREEGGIVGEDARVPQPEGHG